MRPANIYRTLIVVTALWFIVQGLQGIASEIFYFHSQAPELVRRECSDGLSCLITGLVLTLFSGNISRRIYVV